MKSSRGHGAGRAVDRKKQLDPSSGHFATGKHHQDSGAYHVCQSFAIDRNLFILICRFDI